MRALITGASGFVGRHLSAHLTACGDEVSTIDATERLDVRNAEQVAAVVSANRPEIIYHLAAQSNVGSSWSDPGLTTQVNVEGTLNVLEAARAADVGRIVVVSSAEVYGVVTPDQLPITESSPVRPASPYGASKAAAEVYSLMAVRARNQDVVIVRPFNHLGPGQTTAFVTPALAARIAANEVSGETAVVVGNLAARRDLTDVRDVVRAYRLLAELGEAGTIYNVCSGSSVAIQDLADRLLESAAFPMHLQPDPALLRPSDVPILLGDASALKARTGWEPTIPIEQTLDDILTEARTHADANNVRSRSTDQ